MSCALEKRKTYAISDLYVSTNSKRGQIIRGKILDNVNI